MFLSISGGHICVPKLYKNMASPYKALLWCVKYCGPHRPETWTIVYISVYCNISFSWLLPLDCFQVIFFFCLVYCVTTKTSYWKFKILVTRPCVSCLIFAYYLKQNCCQIPLAEWTNEVWIQSGLVIYRFRPLSGKIWTHHVNVWANQ